jgi:hypothetical protein
MDKGEAIYHKINKSVFGDTHEIRVGEGTIKTFKLDRKDLNSWCVVEAGLSDEVRVLCSPLLNDRKRRFSL